MPYRFDSHEVDTRRFELRRDGVPLLARFTEGHDTTDLRQARSLLDTLATPA